MLYVWSASSTLGCADSLLLRTTAQSVDLPRSTQRCCAGRNFSHDGLPSYVKHLVIDAFTYNPSRRFEDHWHDVTIGSILGLTIAYFAYRQYYPSLADELSHRPYSPRIKDEDSDPTLPLHDESKNQRHDQAGGSHVHQSFDLDGTVQRPSPQHLRDAWRDHEDSGVRESIMRPDRRGSGSDHDV